MDKLGLIAFATAIEGICAAKIAKKFDDSTPAWKFFIPIYNVLVYGKFSLVPQRFLYTLITLQSIDLILMFIKDFHPYIASSQPTISMISFSIWAVMVARIAVRLGQGFWGYLAATILSAIASNFTVVAMLYIFVPAFNIETASIPLWAEMVAVVIMSLPFISLAFDKNVQYVSSS